MEPKLYLEALLIEKKIITIENVYTLTGPNIQMAQDILKSITLQNGRFRKDMKIIFYVVY